MSCFASGILAIGASILHQPAEERPQITEPVGSLVTQPLLPTTRGEAVDDKGVDDKGVDDKGADDKGVDDKGVDDKKIWRYRWSGLTNIAAKGGVFKCPIDAKKKLSELLSKDEWRNLREITERDLWKCRLIYVELATIISIFIRFPFGGVTERAERIVCEWLEGAGRIRIPNNWIAGCLLQRSGVSTSKVIDFIAGTLGYMPAGRSKVLECVVRCKLRYSNYWKRTFMGDTRELLLKREESLAANEITAFEFAEQVLSRSRQPMEPLPASSHIRSPLIKSDPTNSSLTDMQRKGTKLLGARDQILDGIQDQDFEACSLDYLELGTIIDKNMCFGEVRPFVVYNIARAMEEGIGSRRVRGWIVGCLLQFAEVPISDLIEFCIKELKYTPAVCWRLECLKRRSELSRVHKRKRPEDAHARFHQLLCGLRKKISISEFNKLSLMCSVEQTSFLRECYYAFRCSENKSADSGINSPTSSSPATDRTVLEPAMMYCHPDDLIEFVHWVDSN
ncbi:hypothetical protein GNI_183550 [Gregarina niphandrodes]|uniref:Uncharacterized protein n=1 Tax=Gregarina niphandrodes TaxID=110365 RepID=A0A023AWR4_GRENI|nr:hypothetical protein GNI_183550 [Gregarina niphandrodes]EZG43186.1 hypothetical protein GNI_183550 [Gregarina niphandrodes]|eukprot:XP_011133554.1 hypothetical protein GNI_183550 [Gregarina niphandrodes]